MPSADFCRPLRIDYSILSPASRTERQISRGKFDCLPHATAGFTTSALDGYGLCGRVPARPAPYAFYPVLVHRLVRLLHASFRPRLATTPLRFAITSPPSGCEKDFHLRAVEHARHTMKSRPVGGRLRSPSVKKKIATSCSFLLRGDEPPTKREERQPKAEYSSLAQERCFLSARGPHPASKVVFHRLLPTEGSRQTEPRPGPGQSLHQQSYKLCR